MKIPMLFAVAALLASPAALAQDMNLCQINLQELEQNLATNQATLGEPARTQVEEYHQQAKAAQSAGDVKACIAHTEKALQMLKGPGGPGTSTPGTSGGGN